jgi:hypothetical protein
MIAASIAVRVRPARRQRAAERLAGRAAPTQAADRHRGQGRRAERRSGIERLDAARRAPPLVIQSYRNAL